MKMLADDFMLLCGYTIILRLGNLAELQEVIEANTWLEWEKW